MKHITGLIGRDELVERVAREARKGRHLLLTGRPGVGKSTILEAVLDRLIVRRDLIVLHVNEHQAKGQFLEIARGLLESGLLKPSALELDAGLDDLDPAALEWAKIKRSVNRLSIRDLTAAIVPALHTHEGRVLIAVDDLTAVTPTLVAFWLAVLDAAQLVACASEKRKNVARLWWKLAEIEVPPLSADSARAIAQEYMAQTGMLVESPELFVGHVVKQSGGNPQALADDDRGLGLGGRGALSGHRHRRHRAVHLRRDGRGGGYLAAGVSVQGRGEGELARRIAFSRQLRYK